MNKVPDTDVEYVLTREHAARIWEYLRAHDRGLASYFWGEIEKYAKTVISDKHPTCGDGECLKIIRPREKKAIKAGILKEREWVLKIMDDCIELEGFLCVDQNDPVVSILDLKRYMDIIRQQEVDDGI